MDHNDQLLQGSVRPALIRFALPFLAASLLQFLYGAVDLIIVGRFCDAAAITSVSNGAEVMQIITNLVVGMSTGVTVLIGQYLGGRRREEMERTFSNGVYLFLLLALVLTLLITLGHNALIQLLQVPEAAVAGASQYLLVCGFGVPFVVGYNLISGTLRAMGDSRSPMVFVGCACVFNILMDLLFVGVLGFGVAGAALATTLAQVLCFLASLVVLRRPDFPCGRTVGAFRPQRQFLLRALGLGFPVAMQNLLVDSSFLIITVIVNLIGLDQAAAVGIVGRIIGFGFLGAGAFMSAIAAMTAQNMGAGQPERARQAMNFGLICSLVLGLVLYGLFVLLDEQLAGLFTPDTVVIRHCALYLRTYALDCILVAFVFCFNGFFSGCGRTGFTMFNSLVSTFLVRVPISYVVSLIPTATLFHLGIAAPAASAVQILLQLIYLRSGRWKTGLVSAPREQAD